MQLSFNSSEPLADVLSVVGRVYGVTLTVTGERPDSPAEKAVSAAGTASAARTVSKPAGRRATASAMHRAAQPAESPSAPEAGLSQRVRAWARDNGVEVSGRGRLPQSTVDAYTAAHS